MPCLITVFTVEDKTKNCRKPTIETPKTHVDKGDKKQVGTKDVPIFKSPGVG